MGEFCGKGRKISGDIGGALVDIAMKTGGGAITNAVESSTLALIRPGLWPAHLPPRGRHWQTLYVG